MSIKTNGDFRFICVQPMRYFCEETCPEHYINYSGSPGFEPTAHVDDRPDVQTATHPLRYLGHGVHQVYWFKGTFHYDFLPGTPTSTVLTISFRTIGVKET